jgi:hypothetical protein
MDISPFDKNRFDFDGRFNKLAERVLSFDYTVPNTVDPKYKLKENNINFNQFLNMQDNG